MVPTEEARITFQMLYSAVPPIGIASARLTMLPPMNSNLFATPWRWSIAPWSEAAPHNSTAVSPSPDSPRLALGVRAGPLVAEGLGNAPVHIRVGPPCQEMTYRSML